MTQVLEQFQSSELSRNSARVFSAAEAAPVLVTRRDGEDFVLMSERESQARERLFELAAALIAVTLDDRGSLVERMLERFQWMLALTEQEQAQCSEELVRAVRASLATGQAQLAMTVMVSWHETAAAIAAGLGTEPVDWLDEPIQVMKP